MQWDSTKMITIDRLLPEYTPMSFMKALNLADENQKSDEDGWSYSYSHVPGTDQIYRVATFDETGHFVGYL